MRTALTAAVAGMAAIAVAAPAAGSPAGGPPIAQSPKINQLVVFRDGTFKEKTVSARRASVRVGGRRCVVGQGLPLAALVVSRVAPLRLHDYGSCSRRPRDAAGLFVKKIGADLNAGQDGWVYKVGRRTGSAGAADPTGPFGHGRLKYGAHVLWFYCHMRGSSCQRTLSFTQIETQPPGALVVHVGAYNDRGRGIPAAGVTVHVDSATGTTDAHGVARVVAGVGRHTMYAEGGGYVQTFHTRVEVQ